MKPVHTARNVPSATRCPATSRHVVRTSRHMLAWTVQGMAGG